MSSKKKPLTVKKNKKKQSTVENIVEIFKVIDTDFDRLAKLTASKILKISENKLKKNSEGIYEETSEQEQERKEIITCINLLCNMLSYFEKECKNEIKTIKKNNNLFKKK